MRVQMRHRLRMRLHVTRTPQQSAQPANVFRDRPYRGTILAIVAWERSLPAQRFPNSIIDYVEQLWMDTKVRGQPGFDPRIAISKLADLLLEPGNQSSAK